MDLGFGLGLGLGFGWLARRKPAGLPRSAHHLLPQQGGEAAVAVHAPCGHAEADGQLEQLGEEDGDGGGVGRPGAWRSDHRLAEAHQQHDRRRLQHEQHEHGLPKARSDRTREQHACAAATPAPGPPCALLLWGSSRLWHTPAGLRSQASVLLTAAETAALALPRSVRESCGPPAGSKRVFDGRRAIMRWRCCAPRGARSWRWGGKRNPPVHKQTDS